MKRAIREALRVRAALGVRGVASAHDVGRAVAMSGVDRLPDEPMPVGLYGVFYDGAMRVRAGLARGAALTVVAHELGHGVLGHAAGQCRDETYLGFGGDPHERSAQVFAYTLLLGRPARTHAGLDRQMRRAYRAGLPLRWLISALEILAPGLPDGSRPRPRPAPPPPQDELAAQFRY